MTNVTPTPEEAKALDELRELEKTWTLSVGKRPTPDVMRFGTESEMPPPSPARSAAPTGREEGTADDHSGVGRPYPPGISCLAGRAASLYSQGLIYRS